MRKVWYGVLLLGLAGLVSACAAVEAEISDQPIGLYPFENDAGQWGFVNAEGQVAIEPQFLDLGKDPFKQGVAAVEVQTDEGKKLWGLINHNGEFVVEPKYEMVGLFSEQGIAPVRLEDKRYFIDRRGNQVLEVKEDYVAVLPFSDGMAAVRVGQKWGFIDKKGNLAIEPKFDLVLPFSDGLAAVQIGEGFDKVYS